MKCKLWIDFDWSTTFSKTKQTGSLAGRNYSFSWPIKMQKRNGNGYFYQNESSKRSFFSETLRTFLFIDIKYAFGNDINN